jgi:hypothetical protein
VIYLLPEQAESQPSTFILEGRNLLITVAGRQLGIESENLEPLPLRPIRWNVISRFGQVCDHLRDGAATLPLTRGAPPEDTPGASPTPSTSVEPPVPTKGDPWLPLAIVVFVGLMLGAFLIARRNGIEDASAIKPGPPAPVDPPDPPRPVDPP